MSKKNRYSFIVRIQIEPRETPNLPFQWKGLIQDVFSGDQRYFDRFDQMTDFILRKISLIDRSSPDPEKAE